MSIYIYIYIYIYMLIVDTGCHLKNLPSGLMARECQEIQCCRCDFIYIYVYVCVCVYHFIVLN